MKRTLLIFPDLPTLRDFVLQEDVMDIEINVKANSLLAELTEEQVTIACSQYNATQILLGPSSNLPPFPGAYLK